MVLLFPNKVYIFSCLILYKMCYLKEVVMIASFNFNYNAKEKTKREEKQVEGTKEGRSSLPILQSYYW